MKRVIILISLIFLLLGCTADKVNSPNESLEEVKPAVEHVLKKQQYSFGPMADLSVIDEKTKQELQSKLNRLGDPVKDKIDFNEISAVYDEDGALFVDIFVRNGYSNPVFNIEATLDVVENGKVIASAPFKFTLDEFGELQEGTSRPWTIYYYPEDVKNRESKLKEYTIEVSNIQYEF